MPVAAFCSAASCSSVLYIPGSIPIERRSRATSASPLLPVALVFLPFVWSLATTAAVSLAVRAAASWVWEASVQARAGAAAWPLFFFLGWGGGAFSFFFLAAG